MRSVARRIASLGWRGRIGLALAAGASMTAGHAPVDLPWALFVAVPILFLLVAHAPRPASAAWIGWAAGFGHFITGLHWIGHAFLVEPERFAWLLPLGTALLPAGLALFWALAFWAARAVWPARPAVAAIWLAALWTLAEHARGTVLTGFPWALPGYVWAETPVIQAAAWIGSYALTLVTLAAAALFGAALASRGAARIAAIALPVATIGGLWIGGALRIPPTTAHADDAPVVRVVQPNAAQALKWRPDHRERFYERAKEATAAAADPALGPPDVVIWPETAVYFPPANAPAEMARLAALAPGARLLFGALHAAGPRDGRTWHNSLFTLLPDGRFGPRYDKHHLVPFGEYLPLPGMFEAVGLSTFAVGGGFGRGEGPRTLTLDGLPPFSPLICYEAIFPDGIVAEPRPDWLVQITNDAWFGPRAGPRQHLAQARIRAIEQGLPMVRAANTGISAVIDPHGRMLADIPLNAHGSVDARLPAPLPPTLYGRVGNLPFGFATAALLALGLVAGAARRS